MEAYQQHFEEKRQWKVNLNIKHKFQRPIKRSNRYVVDWFQVNGSFWPVCTNLFRSQRKLSCISALRPSTQQNKHEKWLKLKFIKPESKYRFNIALIRTSKIVKLSTDVKPIDLPEIPLVEGAPVLYSGFGRIFVCFTNKILF